MVILTQIAQTDMHVKHVCETQIAQTDMPQRRPSALPRPSLNRVCVCVCVCVCERERGGVSMLVCVCLISIIYTIVEKK